MQIKKCHSNLYIKKYIVHKWTIKKMVKSGGGQKKLMFQNYLFIFLFCVSVLLLVAYSLMRYWQLKEDIHSYFQVAVQNSDDLSVFYNFKLIENRWV